jgi:hypothetical protein
MIRDPNKHITVYSFVDFSGLFPKTGQGLVIRLPKNAILAYAHDGIEVRIESTEANPLSMITNAACMPLIKD